MAETEGHYSDDLRALSAAATPGPWAPWGEPGSYVHVWTSDERIVTRDVLSPDAELIVWLRNHADALADLIDATRSYLADSAGRMDAALAALDALDQEAPA